MKQDYLWDKTGEDPEIEKLENALSRFRYQEAAPPELPAKIIPFDPKTPSRFFRLSFGFAAFATLLIVSLIVWFQFSNDTIELAKDSTYDSTKTIAQKNADESPIETEPERRDVSTANDDSIDVNAGSAVRKSKVSKQSVRRKAVKVKKIIPVNALPTREINIARKTDVKKPEVKLTKDEKYAYDQLMTALSITSSKLKMVKDKVENVEEHSAAFSNKR